MCTALTYKTNDFYFGRTLDYEFSYGDDIAILPRNAPIYFPAGEMSNHYAIMGIACIPNGDPITPPLFYEAINEMGLCMAGLNFVGNAYYSKGEPTKDNIAQYQFIPWVLSQCASVNEAKALLENICITDTPFGNYPVAQLHWLIADRECAITLEAVKEGIKIYDNPVGVLTNNPPFEEQLFSLNNYMYLSAKPPKNNFSDKLDLRTYSRGMGALGLPGDLSSGSRFVRASFNKMNSVYLQDEKESVSQFFHILGSVDQIRGCCELEGGKYEITIYTSCFNADKGVLYYTCYDNHQISSVGMHNENLDGEKLITYPMITKEQINYQN